MHTNDQMHGGASDVLGPTSNEQSEEETLPEYVMALVRTEILRDVEKNSDHDGGMCNAPVRSGFGMGDKHRLQAITRSKRSSPPRSCAPRRVSQRDLRGRTSAAYFTIGAAQRESIAEWTAASAQLHDLCLVLI